MHASRARFASLRKDVAPLLLLVFLIGAVLTPVVHLSAHRDDHSHGVSRTHAAAHRAGLPHEHPETPAEDDAPADHGSGSSAHFGLALLQAPPAPAVPVPAETVARRAGPSPRQPLPPILLPQPVRGPPAVSRHSPLLVVDS